MAAPPYPPSPSPRRDLHLLLVVVVLIAVGYTAMTRPVAESLSSLVTVMRDAGGLGIAIYALTYVIATVLMLPGSALTLLAGMVYGPFVGLAIVAPISTLSALCAFLSARWLGRGRLERALAHHPRLTALDQGIARGAGRLVLLLRLSPLVPFNLLNVALGLTAIPVGTYTVASLVGMLPGALLYTTLGASLPDLAALLAGDLRADGVLSDAVWWLGLVATLVVTLWAARLANRALTTALPARASAVIAVFAKPPAPGEVKTRLAEAVSPEDSSALANAFLNDTLNELGSLDWAKSVVASTTEIPFDDRTTETWDQGTGDLGARVACILQRGLTHAGEVYAVGTDAPGLTRGHLEEAREALKTYDAVLGPATDGGFYLLGLTRCPEGLLADLPWSTPETCEATEARLTALGFRVAHLSPLDDIDRPEDLSTLETTVASAPGRLHRTRRWLRDRAEAPLAISVIIPVLNEAARISGQLQALASQAPWHEVIVVDGGSDDASVALAEAHDGVQVIHGPRGRGAQLNTGAAAATGDVLLFLHADVRLPPQAARLMTESMHAPETVAGAFRTRTRCDDDDAPKRWVLPFLPLGDLRPSYTRLPYGDQALFVDASRFHQVEGYPEQPLMEDLELSRRLSSVGRIARLPQRVEVSGRRFMAQPIRSLVIMNTFPLLYALGVSPARLARWYAAIR